MVNSAFLSWTAIQHLANGETLDLRTVPAVVGGDEEKRHGVVLAKSIPAKRYGIQTGESLFMARSKYPNLIVAAPDFDWYVKNSKAMIRIFGDYTPDIEQYSIDEAFLNMTGSEGLGLARPLAGGAYHQGPHPPGAGLYRKHWHCAQPPAGQNGIRL